MGDQGLMSGLQSSNRLFARNRREGIEKFVEAVAAFQVVYEIPQRHASSHEHRSAPQNLRIAVDDCLLWHGTLFTLRADYSSIEAYRLQRLA